MIKTETPVTLCNLSDNLLLPIFPVTHWDMAYFAPQSLEPDTITALTCTAFHLKMYYCSFGTVTRLSTSNILSICQTSPLARLRDILIDSCAAK